MTESVDTIKVCLVGAAGRMGQESAKALHADSGTEVALAIDLAHVGQSLRSMAGPQAPDLVIENSLSAALDRAQVDVLLDFTLPQAAAANATEALKRKIPVVVGTSGLSADEIEALRTLSAQQMTPILIVPNFAIGAVLMMRFADMAAPWMPHAEIIEMHHDRKLDAPSGTARRTAEIIALSQPTPSIPVPNEEVKVDGVRGGRVDGVPIHSVRLPGLIAHQMVLFGSQGETLTIRHDSHDRSSFMPGVVMAVKKVKTLNGLFIGLDAVMRVP